MNFNDKGIEGFDVSRYQDSDTTPQMIDFNKMKAYGATFVISKAGQYYWQDPDFSYNWRESEKAGLARASYWFGDVRDTGVNQARKYWQILTDNGFKGEPCVIDYEHGSWTDWNELYNFIAEFQRLSGLPDERFFIYTGFPYWIEHSPLVPSTLDWFEKHPLWLAWYTSESANVVVPPPWTDVLLWQDGTPPIGKLVGAESEEIDHDKFNGDITKFYQYFIKGNTNPPPTGGNMIYKGTITASALNIRPQPNTTQAPYYAKPMGTLLEADGIENGWWHLTKIDGVAVTNTSYAYEGATGGYIHLDEIIDNTPPPTPNPDSIVITHTFNDALTLPDGTVYTATFEVKDVEYKKTA